MNSIIDYVYEFGSGRGSFRKHMYVSISMNSLINYVYEFGSGRGKLHTHTIVFIFNEFLN